VHRASRRAHGVQDHSNRAGPLEVSRKILANHLA
jgi:hypothetical protein